MCGRYTLRDPEAIKAALRALGVEVSDPLPLRYNTAPTQVMPVVCGTPSGSVLAALRWGIVPFFSRSSPRPLQLINARSETAAEKPSFRQSVQKRRCIVPADGFFEWRRDSAKSKTPFFIRMQEERPFFMAGCFEEESLPFAGGYILLTTGPNELMAPIHDRMPAILDEPAAREWLEPGPIRADRLRKLCASYPAAEMKADAVGMAVNSAQNDNPECIAPAADLGQASLGFT